MYASCFNMSQLQIRGGSHIKFSYFAKKTYVVGTHQKCLGEALLMSITTCVFLLRNKKKKLFSG